MTETIFPVIGTAFVLVVVLPFFALLAKLLLTMLEHDRVAGPLRVLSARYLLLVGSSVLPLAWFISAGMHQAESGQSVLACLFDHDASALCFEPGLFVLLLGLVLAGRGVPVVRTRSTSRAWPEMDTDGLARRVEQIVAMTPSLRALRGRVLVTSEVGFAIGTQSFLRPTVVIGAGFAKSLADGALAAALAHEVEHARLFDPLRYLLLELALAMNPFGRFLLDPHAARWHGAREAQCDREAVIRGAAPLDLADAIVRAARPEPDVSLPTVALGPRNASLLEMRVGMLLAFAERRPIRTERSETPAVSLALALLVLTLLLPHRTSTAALDALHIGAEHALFFFRR